MRDLDGGERLDVDAGMALAQAAEHGEVIVEPQLGMQAADDVELARGVVAGGVGLGEHVVERAGVGARLRRHARERAEHARVTQHADVGGVDVLVGGEVDAVAVVAAVGEVGEAADREEVGRVEQRQRVVPGQPLAALDLVSEGSECGVFLSAVVHAARRTATVALCPPNPNELDRATSTLRFTTLFAAASRSHAGSGVNWLMVGGIMPVPITSADSAASSAPAAPSRCPVIDLVDAKISLRAWAPNTAFTAAVSAASPCGVEVPCALM